MKPKMSEKFVRHDNGKTGVIVGEIGEDFHFPVVVTKTGMEERWHLQSLTWLHLVQDSSKDFSKLDPGLYKVYWKGGGHSLAAVGMNATGDRWLAPTNWISPTVNPDIWETIKDVDRIEE